MNENLAEKISMLRKRAGWSQEELAERLGVTRQSVSKWEGAQSVPDIDKILQMSRLFGVTTDYLLKEEAAEETMEAEAVDMAGRHVTHKELRRVSMEEAEEFLSLKKASAPKQALATFLCIVSPITLLLLAAMSEISSLHISEDAAGGIGLIVLLCFVAAGAALFISVGSKLKEYDFLASGPFETSYGVADMVKARRKDYQAVYSRLNIIGTVLCILSAVPLFAACIVENDLVGVAAVCLLLFLVGIGVAAFVYGGTYQGAMDCLLEEGDYTRKNKARKSVKGAVSLIYWLVVTAVFLYYTFGPRGNGQPKYSWIIWAIAGVLFGAVMAVVNLIQHGGRERQSDSAEKK